MNSMNHNPERVVTRFAPSPTGVLHVGSVRTALFSFLYARKYGGSFILRIEDTDKERSEKAYEENILEGLRWLGITHDEFYRQSERGDVYKKYLEQLIASGAAYISQEEGGGEGKRASVIRFKNPNKKVVFRDEVRGDIEIDTTDLGDFVIAKDLDTPLYNFAVVVDDFDMGVTHVIRGDDGIANTPRQVLIQEALGAPRPIYAHLPLILAPDRSKLSKRHGAVSVTEYRDMGYLPEAVVNFLALIGWNPGGEQEVFSMEELTELFSLEKIQKAGAVFNLEKLNWLNRHYLKDLSEDSALQMIMAALPPQVKLFSEFNEGLILKLLPVILERADNIRGITDAFASHEYDYFFTAPEYQSEQLLWKGETDHVRTAKRLETVIDMIQTVPDTQFSAETIKQAVWDFAEQEGRGSVLWPTRFALSGRERSPDPLLIASIIGKDETVKRLLHEVRALTA